MGRETATQWASSAQGKGRNVIDEILAEGELKMDAAVEHVKEEFAAIRTGRAHPGMFNSIMAEVYGQSMPIQQIATVQIVDARMVTVQPYDVSTMAAIEKAIRDSELGNPASDGHQIRVGLPQLTEQRRKDYIKVAKTKAEEAHISVRNARRVTRDALDKLVKDKQTGEDEVHHAEKVLDAETKKRTDAIDELLKNKEAELLEV
ncbi:ribosome recycling factor [Propioniferax innocua]|uniref:Ribosome-recycling factor n=1 Tax=Propioniferax innocua TaxID=1753 RepID=A0A542ZAC8_9ACTN|nr:ribosome recycling factor [Propioniferax innocua]